MEMRHNRGVFIQIEHGEILFAIDYYCVFSQLFFAPKSVYGFVGQFGEMLL